MNAARLVGGAAAVVMGLLHGTAILGWVDRSGPDSPGLRVPVWARVAWMVAAAVTVVGGVLVLADAGAAVAILAIGLVASVFLAILNGFFIHGRPTISHHVVRTAVATVILTLAVIGA